MEYLLGATVKKNIDSALFRNLSSNPRMAIFGMKDIFARIMLEGKKWISSWVKGVDICKNAY